MKEKQNPLYTSGAAARFLGMHPVSLVRLRRKGRFLPPDEIIQAGKKERALWRESTLLSWLAAKKFLGQV